jgi:hypothetical protein
LLSLLEILAKMKNVERESSPSRFVLKLSKKMGQSQPGGDLGSRSGLYKNILTLVIPKPALSARNLLLASNQAADSSRGAAE